MALDVFVFFVAARIGLLRDGLLFVPWRGRLRCTDGKHGAAECDDDAEEKQGDDDKGTDDDGGHALTPTTFKYWPDFTR